MPPPVRIRSPAYDSRFFLFVLSSGLPASFFLWSGVRLPSSVAVIPSSCLFGLASVVLFSCPSSAIRRPSSFSQSVFPLLRSVLRRPSSRSGACPSSFVYLFRSGVRRLASGILFTVNGPRSGVRPLDSMALVSPNPCKSYGQGNQKPRDDEAPSTISWHDG